MKNYRQRSKTVTATVPLALLLWVIGFCVAPQSCPAEDAAETSSALAAPSVEEGIPVAEGPPTEGPRVGTAGLRVYIDPATGKFTTPPPQGPITPLGMQQLSPNLRSALSRSRSGLAPVRNTGPGGGVSVDLQGRFQQGSTAVINPDGSVSVKPIALAPTPSTIAGEGNKP